jgi:HD superfamily phosphohydrolase YqeK
MKNFDLIKKEIESQLKKSELELDNEHSQLTRKWVLKQKPDADIPLQIAALAHDYERSFPNRERSESYNSYEQYKQVHAKKGAKMVADLMMKYNFSSDDIKKVKYLIENHEVGGSDGDLQILTNADSLSYFEGSVPWYRKTHSEKQTVDKIVFMYKRMSKNVRKFIEQVKFEDKELNKLYQNAINNL